MYYTLFEYLKSLKLFNIIIIILFYQKNSKNNIFLIKYKNMVRIIKYLKIDKINKNWLYYYKKKIINIYLINNFIHLNKKNNNF